MKRKSILNVSAALFTAIISAIILYETLMTGSLLKESGLIGIFLAAMFSHLTVIGRGLFVPAFLPLTALYHPVLLGLSAGLGAAIGEVTTYYWGLGLREALENGEKNSVLMRWFKKFGLAILLLVAASPLPDTPIILLSGSARLSLRKLLFIQGIGKTAFYSLGAALGAFILGELGSVVEGLFLSTILLIGSIIFVILISWSKSRNKMVEILQKLSHR